MIFPIEATEGTTSKAELVFFEFAKKFFGVSQEVDVFHSVRISGKKGSRFIEHEVDFIMISAKSIVCIEVKGGVVSLNQDNNGWFQNSSQIENPVDQAIKNKHAFIARFGKELDHIQVFWAVAFPDVKVSSFSELPIGIEPINIIDWNTLKFLDKWFESLESEAFKASSIKPFPSKNAIYSRKRIQQVLARSMNFIPNSESRLAYNELKFDQLLNEQKALIEALSVNDKLLIVGPAGSGKTILGIHFGLKQVEMGKSVLFLTFNKNLAKNYSYKIEREYSLPEVGSFQVTTFHSWAKLNIECSNPGWWIQNSKSEEFWDLEVPLKLQSLFFSSEAQFDAIIIDEAQDFQDLWLEPVLLALKESGKMIVMLDPNQDIFNRDNEFSKLGFMKIPMKAVIRQTKALTKQIASILELELSCHEKCPEGESISMVGSVEQFKQKYETDGWPLESLVVLYDPKCGLGNFTELRFGRNKLVITKDGRGHKGIIPAVSINVFKGLEAQIVLIPNFHQISSNKLKYVAMSRAKSHLYLHV